MVQTGSEEQVQSPSEPYHLRKKRKKGPNISHQLSRASPTGGRKLPTGCKLSMASFHCYARPLLCSPLLLLCSGPSGGLLDPYQPRGFRRCSHVLKSFLTTLKILCRTPLTMEFHGLFKCISMLSQMHFRYFRRVHPSLPS